MEVGKIHFSKNEYFRLKNYDKFLNSDSTYKLTTEIKIMKLERRILLLEKQIKKLNKGGK